MGEVIQLPTGDNHEGERLLRLIANGRIDDSAAALGSGEEWGWTAVVYLKDALSSSQGGACGGPVLVSAAAVSSVISLLESYAARLGVI